MKRIPKTITLLLTFMKIGLFTFGGGSVVVKDIPNDSVAVGNPASLDAAFYVKCGNKLI